MSWYYREKEHIVFCLKVTPNAAKNQVKEIWNDLLKVQIKAAPSDGVANQELTNFFAKMFSVKKQQVEIISGTTNRIKKVRLPATAIVEEFIKTR